MEDGGNEMRSEIAKSVAKRSGAFDDQALVQTIARDPKKKYSTAEDKWRMSQITKNKLHWIG